MWFWKKKKPVDEVFKIEVDLADSLKKVVSSTRMKAGNLSLSLADTAGGGDKPADRTAVEVTDGDKRATWRVESLASLFRGARQPPAEIDTSKQVEALMPFLLRIEQGMLLFCSTSDTAPTDNEFVEIYTQMRRRPDGKSMGRAHDLIWQSAALVLGTSPWSEAEYSAAFGLLARSARRHREHATSRNYHAFVTRMLEGGGGAESEWEGLEKEG